MALTIWRYLTASALVSASALRYFSNRAPKSRLLLTFQCLPSQESISPPGSRNGTSRPRKLLPGGCSAAGAEEPPAGTAGAGAAGAGAGASGTWASSGATGSRADRAKARRTEACFMGWNDDGAANGSGFPVRAGGGRRKIRVCKATRNTAAPSRLPWAEPKPLAVLQSSKALFPPGDVPGWMVTSGHHWSTLRRSRLIFWLRCSTGSPILRQTVRRPP